jgi:hypothetical protein
MQDVLTKIVESGRVPTRQDIADLLASVAPPGQSRAAKEAAILTLFEEAGHSDSNSQGHSVITTLDSYGEY